VTHLFDGDDIQATRQAGTLIRNGELVVIPTETVYGLAAAADDPVAVTAIFRAKGRPQDNPLIVHLASVADALSAIPRELRAARAAIEAFAPGPLTVVVPAPPWVAPQVSAGLDTVALRVPDHPVACAVIAAAGVPVAAPSANRSGRPSPTTFAMARHEMEGRVAAIIDGGECSIGIESTVVDGTEPGALRLLRPGLISAESIRRRTGFAVETGMSAVDMAGASRQTDAVPTEDVALRRSPGTRYRHYRPSLPVIAFEHQYPVEALAREIRRAGGDSGVRVILGPRGASPGDGPAGAERSAAPFAPGASTSVPTTRRSEVLTDGLSPLVNLREMPDWTTCARALYREFWLAERDGVRRLYVELPDRASEEGLYDRIARAASEILLRGRPVPFDSRNRWGSVSRYP
jgi:tRNA threonylcarbamoyl adenosine modification protein (Sua5/YciO/YrdC/YwlC family)